VSWTPELQSKCERLRGYLILSEHDRAAVGSALAEIERLQAKIAGGENGQLESERDNLRRENQRLQAENGRLTAIKRKVHMYCWAWEPSFLAVAQAENVEAARAMALREIGEEGGDGSCPERDKARNFVRDNTPAIWYGNNAEFVLTDNAELREAEAQSEKRRESILRLESERDDLRGNLAGIVEEWKVENAEKLSLRDANNALSAEVTALKAVVGDLKSELREANYDGALDKQTINGLLDKLNTANGENGRLKKDVSELSKLIPWGGVDSR
jgi:hypothetical protein